MLKDFAAAMCVAACLATGLSAMAMSRSSSWDSLGNDFGAANGASNAAYGASDGAANAAYGAANAAFAGANAVSAAASLGDDPLVNTPKLKLALLNSAALRGSSIDVSSTLRSVTLTGSVRSAAQKSLAGAIARQVAPGFRIENRLRVVRAAEQQIAPFRVARASVFIASADEFSWRVQSALAGEPELSGARINVQAGGAQSSKSGARAMVLSGSVRSQAQVLVAEARAHQTAPEFEIVNRLRVAASRDYQHGSRRGKR